MRTIRAAWSIFCLSIKGQLNAGTTTERTVADRSRRFEQTSRSRMSRQPTHGLTTASTRRFVRSRRLLSQAARPSAPRVTLGVSCSGGKHCDCLAGLDRVRRNASRHYRVGGGPAALKVKHSCHRWSQRRSRIAATRALRRIGRPSIPHSIGQFGKPVRAVRTRGSTAWRVCGGNWKGRQVTALFLRNDVAVPECFRNGMIGALLSTPPRAPVFLRVFGTPSMSILASTSSSEMERAANNRSSGRSARHAPCLRKARAVRPALNVCVVRATRTGVFSKRNNGLRHLQTGWALFVFPPSASVVPLMNGLASYVLSLPSRNKGGVARHPGSCHQKTRMGAVRTRRSQRGAIATLLHSLRWLPRNRRTLLPANKRRAVTAGDCRGSGSARERCAVQQADQPDALAASRRLRVQAARRGSRAVMRHRYTH